MYNIFGLNPTVNILLKPRLLEFPETDSVQMKVLIENLDKKTNLGVQLSTSRAANNLARALENNKTITELSISAKIGCLEPISIYPIIQVLNKNDTLISLNLSGNHIGNEDAMALAEVLKFNKSLTNVNLRANDIGDKGAEALINLFEYNTTLVYLSLDGESRYEVENASRLKEYLKRNKETLAKNNEERMAAVAASLDSNQGGPFMASLVNLIIEYDLGPNYVKKRRHSC